MKSKLYILFLCFGNVLFAQFGPQIIISTEASPPYSVKTADIDGDGDIDVLSASYGDDTIAWYENLDGQGTFGPIQIISNTLDSTQHLYVADIDGDEDMDVIADSRTDDMVVWYENLDGLGTFSTANLISTTADNPKEVIAADLDGDGDNDVVVASRDDNKVAWYENLDGFGNFGTERIISNSILDAISIYAIDLDGDLDFDILASSAGNQSLYWIKNLNGQGDFGILREISSNSSGIISVNAADLDNDGDNDVLSCQAGGNTIDWFENLNGVGSFGPQQIISVNFVTGASIDICDLDNDFDFDVVWAATGSDEVVWSENDGNGNFGPKQIISLEHDNPTSVSIADIDGDDLKDIVACSIADNKIAWYKNEILSTPDTPSIAISLSPNPTKDLLFIKNKERIEITQIIVYNVLGSEVLKPKPVENTIDLTVLSKGLYLVQIITEKGIITQKVVKK